MRYIANQGRRKTKGKKEKTPKISKRIKTYVCVCEHAHMGVPMCAHTRGLAGTHVSGHRRGHWLFLLPFLQPLDLHWVPEKGVVSR